MATRSTIAFRNATKEVKVYSHWDGYLDWNGMILLTKYNSKRKIKKLLKNGSISILGTRINPSKHKKHSFDFRTQQKDVCVFYHRDRGEKLTFLGKYEREEYNYIFHKGKWFCATDNNHYFNEIKVKRVNGFFKVYTTEKTIENAPISFYH